MLHILVRTIALALASAVMPAHASRVAPPVLATRRYVLTMAADGTVTSFRDRKTGVDYLAHAGGPVPLARITLGRRSVPVTSLVASGPVWRLSFADTGFTAVLKAVSLGDYGTLEVLSTRGQATELQFLDLPLTLKGVPDEPFAVCALALNLRTNVPELPMPSSRVHAQCTARFGMVGAKVALIACAPAELRRTLQRAVAHAPDVPHSPIGGPWALGKAINQGSYLFNFGGLTERTVGDWIRLARMLGVNQIDFHGGNSFRFGDCRPNPQMYPKGLASLKAVIDRLHAAGIKAGLHTYAFFIDKRCPWVTPVPDSRLAASETFTLADPLAPDAKTIPVLEPTNGVSTVTGFFVRNSVTLRIDQELITFSHVSAEAPWRFSGCIRGAYGTKPAPHARGAKVYHLKECFGLFVPDPDTTLFEEVAQKTADAYNTAGFDMIYLDALDGEDILGGAADAWHYGSAFVWELWKRLKKPALMEMSTFHHHLWYVRSRLGAWDHPTRSHKEFIDAHVAANRECRRMFLPGQLGWWAFRTWTGLQGEPTFADDIEYLMNKCLGTDTGFAVMGVDPETIRTIPALSRLAAITRTYEALRHSRKVGPHTRELLAAPAKEYTLLTGPPGPPRFAPVEHTLHRVEAKDGPSTQWAVRNPFSSQPVHLRLEALMAAAPYDSPDAFTIPGFTDPRSFTQRAGAPGVVCAVKSAPQGPSMGIRAMEFTAMNAGDNSRGAWCSATETFSAPLDLSNRQALGLWVYGDGKGELLNIQLRCPPYLVAGIGDHYIPIDFTGWRYFELIEPEGRRWAEHVWPYGDLYSIYRESVNFGAVASINVWYNDLPPGQTVSCLISEMHALPLVPTKLIHPAIRVGAHEATFPVQLESGSYLEWTGGRACKVYGPKGELLQEADVTGEIPLLSTGLNTVSFHCDAPAGVSARANVNVWVLGPSFQGTR
ncbi:MAG: hypothetical protein ACP5VE_09295 [Chthonomonadales bacterium]